LLPILTKYLTPEDYGVLAIFNATTRFIIATLSLGSAHLLMVHLIDLKKEAFSTYLKSFFALTVFNTLIYTILVLIYVLLFDSFFGIPSWLAVLIPFISLLVVIFETASGITMYTKKHKSYAIISLTKFFIETLASLFLIVCIGLNWIGRVEGLIIGSLVVLVIIYNYLKKENYLLGSITQQKIKELASQGSPLLFMSVSITVMNLSDRFFIERLVGIADTGIYNIGAVIGGIELIFVNAIISVFRPMIYNLLKEKKIDLKLQLTNITILSITLLLLNLFTGLIFDLLIDEKYLTAKPYVFPISLGFFFWGISSYYLSHLLYFKENRINAYISVFSMVLNLILNYFLITEYSTIGAAYATAITYFTIAAITYTLTKVTLNKANLC
jgi:O-antigen/teichoic acid export membrane protein